MCACAGIERELIEEGSLNVLLSGSTMSSQFNERWNITVTKLSKIRQEHNRLLAVSMQSSNSSSSSTCGENGNDEEGDEWVEQEGCPEDSDFNKCVSVMCYICRVLCCVACCVVQDCIVLLINATRCTCRWSHHSCVRTCDDEVMKLAMADSDGIVSHVLCMIVI